MTIPPSNLPSSGSGSTSPSSAAGPSLSGSSSTSATRHRQPLRTTKETHPHLPPGLILDENGKVCKVCNTWQDFAKIKKKKQTTVAGEGSGSGTGEASGSGAKKTGGVGGMAGFASMMGGFAASGGGSSSSPGSSSTSSSTTATARNATTSAAQSLEAQTSPIDRSNCPPDTAELGRSTWTFLHTTAAYYPLSAPPPVQNNMLNLLSSLSLLYPCNWCANDFQKDIKVNPPDVSGREGLMKWLCMRHNEVNRKLGKQEFSCQVKDLDIRWKDGPSDGSCD
ncbi:mitochondrial FAD-linked sulfhydryl oxidase ERV1 [Kwoniella heveanensis CBS 569]|uniref:Sulfhydryl oxidase n=1 Tax=Kwoniella heveanensis BCC8398 TaxID=1296120 RepID=A0A1B9H1S2_9TREE|nr:mitochondrial FAD-linked sulfhydryl oxidase ERV1 [Kwoniella heveanensis BCC8398]OCF45965.1 mitochondrial FAD-linked sulfhydryl oxidase ERV1 [Kwoniella heveanensis CBS 569]